MQNQRQFAPQLIAALNVRLPEAILQSLSKRPNDR